MKVNRLLEASTYRHTVQSSLFFCFLSFLVFQGMMTHNDVVLSCLPLSTAYADDGDSETNQSSNKPKEIDQESLDKAERLFFKGLTLFYQKKYEEATQYFQKAYQLVPHRDLLFNVARSREHMGDQAGAIEWYQAYLATKPTDETTVIHRLKFLGVKTTPAQVNPQPKQFDEPSQSSGGIDEYIPWITLGTGVILAGLGTVYGLDALESAEQARNAQIISAYQTAKTDAEGKALIADVSLSLGAVALLSGLYLWYRLDQSNTLTPSVNKSGQVQMGFDQKSVRLGYQLQF